MLSLLTKFKMERLVKMTAVKFLARHSTLHQQAKLHLHKYASYDNQPQNPEQRDF